MPTFYLVSYIRYGTGQETGKVYVKSALFTRIRLMKQYLTELLGEIQLSSAELDLIIDGNNYKFDDDDERASISVVKMHANTKTAESIV